MKRIKLRTLVAVCLAIALLGGALTVFSLAQGNVSTVTYDHKAKQFTFDKTPYTVGNDSRRYPDLFTDLKELMPGDTVTQDITVQAQNVSGGTVYIYLRTDPDNKGDITEAEQADYQQLLERDEVSLTVKKDGAVLSGGDLDKGVLLGKFRGGDKAKLEVTLSIDQDAGNELQGLQAGIGWVFTA